MLRNLISVIAFLTLSLSASAQTATAILKGRVTDKSDLPILGAKVTILNQRTGVTYKLATNAEGLFVQPFLNPGRYQLRVEQEGFETHLVSDITLAVQQTLAIDVTMTIGAVTTTVEVTAAGAQLATATSSMSTVVENKQMQDLPIESRNPYALTLLVPGVMPIPNCYPDRADCRTGPTLWAGPSPTMGGGRYATHDFSID